MKMYRKYLSIQNEKYNLKSNHLFKNQRPNDLFLNKL